MIVMLVSQISFSDNKLHDFMPVKQLAHALNFGRRFFGLFNQTGSTSGFYVIYYDFF